MSVILDALHKARGDRRTSQEDPHANTVARVVDAGAITNSDLIASEKMTRPARGWIAPMAIAFGTLCLIALIGGAFFLLYDQMRRLEARTAAAVAETSSPAPAPAVAQVDAAVAPAVLPTPLPLSELPVQPPAAAPSAISAGPSAVAPAAVSAPEFDLGSIVCENEDCLASLNGRSVRVGDVVKGYKVTAVMPSTITLKSTTGNDEITLSLYD